MMIAALAFSTFMFSQQAAKEPLYQPDRVREGCGFTAGSDSLVPIVVGLFFESDPPFADVHGQAVRVGTRWVHPDQAPYATGASRAWFRNNDPITHDGRRYVKYGLPRVFGIDEVEVIGEHDGLAITSGGADADPSSASLLVLSEPASCGFQPYRPR